MRIYRLIARIRSTSVCVSLVTSQDVTLPLVASSQPPVNRLESVTFSTGPRTWASILQIVTTDPGPGWANPVKTPVICKVITSFRLCLQTGPAKSGCSEKQSCSLTGCSELRGSALHEEGRDQPRSLTDARIQEEPTGEAFGNGQLPDPNLSQSLFPVPSGMPAGCAPITVVDQILRTFRPEICFFFIFFSFPQTAVKSAVLAVQMWPIALYVPDVNRCALSMTSLGQPPSQSCCWWVETTRKEKQMWQCNWLTQQHPLAS